MTHDSTQPRTLGGAQAVKAALLASKDLRPSERLVLVAIAAHSNYDTGEAFPSVATIAEHAGVSPRTVHRVLAKLVQLGRLVVRKVAGIASNVYRVVLDAVTPQAERSAISASDSANPAAGSATESGTVAHEVPEGQSKMKGRAGARDWRQWLKSKNPNPNPQRPPYGYPERRGAALPPPRDAERCPRHIGQTASHCAPCRSERLGGAR
ncbi:helix-turn-helix domain-containing protein [Micromonospora sp. WMMA1998]|uniref:helix-turn-helix domain-containing protein n=1 Tax=Micromonospora sp. WMMA1998 TaxID=3015167 RepID=UPI00248C7594|nr:helix-turn-helix domain-containing protein [Micromonospora sp. WMMA1998]WBC17574.1 helix-turn-helix domain-containing protein [Micromonospora sp. WMMA1998]